MIRRGLAFLLTLCALIPIVPAWAEVEFMDGWTKEIIEGHFPPDDDEIEDMLEDNGRYISIGAQYKEKDKEDFNASSPALYTAKLHPNISIYAERDINGERVENAKGDGMTVEVLDVGTFWCVVRYHGKLGYSKREKLSNFVPVAPNAMPYGVQKHSYVARTAKVTYVRIGMSHEDAYWVVLKPGTTLTIWKIQDG